MLPTKITIHLDKDVSVAFEGIHMRVTRLSKIFDDKAWRIDAHSNYEFHYVYEGEGRIRLGNKE